MYFTLRSYLLAALATITLAQVRLDPIPGTLQAGEAIDISWTTDQDYVHRHNRLTTSSRTLPLTVTAGPQARSRTPRPFYRGLALDPHHLRE